MDILEDLHVSLEDPPASLPRTSSNPDLTKLFKRTRSAQSQTHAASRQSENSVSDNSQILYMADSKKLKTRKARQSLSSIGNNVDRRFDGSLDERENGHDTDELAWNIIDQEIYEWQYVCRTGRPYWWSPESKYARLKTYKPRLTNGPSPTLWMKELDSHPKQTYSEKRRAVSDNYFCDPKSINDIAHLVAVQLLGACFTLPPNHILGVPSPDYTANIASAGLPDPRMISSLRMHTQFRYSPSFGHQARNTSPTQAWPRSLGRPSPGSSSPTANIGTGASSRRGQRRRTLSTTDGSRFHGSLESNGNRLARSCSSTDGLDNPEMTTTHRSKGSSYTNAYLGISSTADQESGLSRKRTSRRRRDGHTMESEQEVPKTNYRLEPVIRSEPHHVFIQPVRELVVKRWTNFKRRLSGSLHSALPTRSSHDRESSSDVGSPSMSSDGKLRRLRAQERGDIHSSDTENTQHFSTPTGEIPATNGGLSTPDRINGATFRLSNPSIADLPQSGTEGNLTDPQLPAKRRSRKQISPSESSLSPMGYHNHAAEQPREPPSRPPFPLYSPARFNSSNISNSFSSSRRPNRKQRKSTLSEMYTAGDVTESGTADPTGRGTSSAPVSANATPLEELKQEPDMTTASIISSSRDQAMPFRPRVGRTSTSGTQIFTPADDGIEVDGLPVGPSEMTWIRHGRRERTYL